MDFLTVANDSQRDYIWLAASLTAVGVALIIVHAVKETITEYLARRRLVQNNLNYVLKSAEQLIKKLIPLLVQPVQSAITPTYQEITTYRLVHFLSSVHFFQCATFDTPAYRFLNNIEIFLDRKIPMALRGSLYHFRPLTAEVQESLSDFPTPLGAPELKLTDFTYRQFLQWISNDEEYRRSYEAAKAYFEVGNGSAILNNASNMDVNSNQWASYVAACHFAIYLLDFYMDFADTPVWEDHRLYFVDTVREWSRMSGHVMRNKIYLYDLQDLNSDNYVRTYSMSVLSRYPTLRVLAGLPFLWRYRLFEDAIKLRALRTRGNKYKHRHLPKRIQRTGVRISSLDRQSNLELRYGDNPSTIRHHVIGILLNRM